MNWGVELWDQKESISNHTWKGIEFLDRYGSFLKERQNVEIDYAKNLRNLVKKYSLKKKDDGEKSNPPYPPFTYEAAFSGILDEILHLACQHETVAETYHDEVCPEVARVSKQLKEERKAKLNEISKLDQCWAQSRNAVYKAKKEYFKMAKDAEAARFKYEKAEGDMNLSRAEVEKARNFSISRSQQAEAAKSTYAKQVQEANDYQHKYLNDLLPEVLEALCDLDSSRVVQVQRLLKKCIEIERSVLPVMEKCLGDMMKETERINPSEDAEAVVQRYRTGYPLPDDISFHEYSAEGCSTTSASELSNGGSSQAVGAEPWNQSDPLSRKETRNLHRALSGRKKGTFRKIFRSRTEDYSRGLLEELPPIQQCRKLEFLLTECKKQLKNRLEMKDGLVKLQTAYSETPQFGSAAEVQTNLESCESEINSLSVELQKLETMYKEACTRINVPVNTQAVSTPAVPSTRPPKRSSCSDESLSQASEASVGNGVQTQNSYQNIPGETNSEACIPHVDSDFYDQAVNDYYNQEESNITILGHAVAMYDFPGGNEGMVPIAENDEVLVLEIDTGDGWTKVRKKIMDKDVDGFVPTSYLKLSLYPDV